MVVCAVWYFGGSTERTHRAEIAASLKGVKYRVKCGACGAIAEMDAGEYLANLGPEGVQCASCGKNSALQIGTVDSLDPSQFQEEMKSITTVSEARMAARAVQEELDRVQRALDAAELANDTAKLASLNAEKAKLNTKSIAIYARWEELRN